MAKAQQCDAVQRDRVVAAHVVHNLPHLVVESFFGITDESGRQPVG
jgi:hypothetical protein